jgi:hypothetical protein
VTGGTFSSNFPTLNSYQTYQGGVDVFVAKLSSSGNALIYSTYLGGGSYEGGAGIAVDDSGNAYVTGYTYSTNFPTFNPYQGTYQGGTCDAFVTKLHAYPANDVSDETTPVSLPEKPSLDQNYPNPFNPTTTIRFKVEGQRSKVPLPTTLKIHNVLGESVRTLVNEGKLPGDYTVQWDGMNDKGEPLASGVYFYELRVGNNTSAKKMVMLK